MNNCYSVHSSNLKKKTNNASGNTIVCIIATGWRKSKFVGKKSDGATCLFDEE